MAQDLVAQFGNLALNNSNWRPVYVEDDYVSRIPPSGNLQYWNSTFNNSDYTYLRYSRDIADPVANFATTMALDYYFRPKTFSYSAACTYPISGQYGFLNRLLRYRYSGDAFESDPKDHEPNQYGDLDLEGIFPILVAGCIMLTPILNWSSTVRKNARIVAVCWGGLMFAALVPSFWKVWKGVEPVIVLDQLVTCVVDVAKNCTSNHFHEGGILPISYDFYDICNDTCGAVSVPHTPFRKGQALQAYLISDSTIKLTSTDSVYQASIIDAVFLCFIIGHGILGLLEVEITQAELRNKTFLLLSGPGSYRTRIGFVSRTRYYIAKSIGSFLFMLAIAVAIISPAVFISSAIINEIIVWGYPISEAPDAWSTYVGAAFVLTAAVIQEFHSQWRKARPESAIPPKLTISIQSKVRSILATLGGIFGQRARPLVHARKSFLRSRVRVMEEWEDFRLWWNDPIYRSDKPHYRKTHYQPLSPSTEMQPLEGDIMHIHRATTTIPIPSSFAMHSPKRPSAVATLRPENSLSPLILANSRLASPQPVADEHNYFNDSASSQDPVHRHTYERRPSAV
ncbi:MAG: hypothetical protein Q9191_001713 [Dirinaria sp. TL-2023a]